MGALVPHRRVEMIFHPARKVASPSSATSTEVRFTRAVFFGHSNADNSFDGRTLPVYHSEIQCVFGGPSSARGRIELVVLTETPLRERGEVDSSGGRMSSLDGLRAVSIVMVILGHLNGTRRFFRLDMGIGDYAHLGVTVFFVISGFLITTLLISERKSHGSISLRLFYARRSVRIFPASFTYLIAMAFLAFGGLIRLNGLDFVCGFSYTMNYLPNRSWQVGHLWSLSVEEQFYLLWPLLFTTMRPKNATRAVIAAIGIGVLARLAARVFLVGTPYRDLEMFPMVADSLAAGCLLALQRTWLESQAWYRTLWRPGWSVVILGLILVINRYGGYTIAGVFGTSIVNLGLGILVHRSVYYANDFVGKLLNWRPIAFIGVLSYSLYLWQQLFLNRNSSHWINAFPENLILAFAAALASYFAVEKPLLGIRKRLRKRYSLSQE